MLDNEDFRLVEDEPPPFLGRWPRLYAVVVVYVAAVICLLYAFTRAWMP